MQHTAERHDTILILDDGSRIIEREQESIARQIPSAEIVIAKSLEQYGQLVQQKEFDLVVLDYDLSGPDGMDLIHKLKVKDHKPFVLVVSAATEPRVVSQMYAAGCQRYLVKEGRWIDELGPAVRHLLRIRRLEEENNRLLAKLTEANMLLEEKNRRLDEFSATVAHDIRGPLGGVCMKLEYLLDTYRQKLEPRCAQLVEGALRSSIRLTDIVQAMYEFAKLGSRAAKMTEVELPKLVAEVVADMNFDAALDIHIGIDPELPTVWGNTELLRRVFTNLIGNAVKYSNRNDIVINVGVRSFVDRTLAHFCEIFVQDNGPGIAEEDLKDIFGMFARGSATNSSKEGLGIGLAVVQRIIELHYGKVRVESAPGAGATFLLLLPLEKIDFVNR